MAEWSQVLPQTAHCSPLRACPDGWVVSSIATDCSLLRVCPDGWVVSGTATDCSLLTAEGLPWWLSGLRYYHRLLTTHRLGPALMAEWSQVLPQTAHYSPLRACPDGWVVSGITTDCSLLTAEGLPWWLSGLRHCHRLLTAHRWGPALMAEWS